MEQTEVYRLFDEWMKVYFPNATYHVQEGGVRFAKAAYVAGYTKRILDEVQDGSISKPKETRSFSSLFRRNGTRQE
jgi:hypothetical protein